MGKIMFFSGLGMIEIYCIKKNLVRAMGIILVAISNDRSVNLNGQVRIMAQAQNVDTYFEPQVLLHKKYILTQNDGNYVWYCPNFRLRSVLVQWLLQKIYNFPMLRHHTKVTFVLSAEQMKNQTQ